MLAQHEPFPAVVMDRGWTIVRANDGAQRLFGRLFAPEPIPQPANVLRLMIEPGPARDHLANWDEVVPALLERARREAVGGVLDQPTADLVERLRTRPDVAALEATGPAATAATTATATAPVVDVRFRIADTTYAFFSVISTLGTPVDVTAQELRVEAFFPSDDATRAVWTSGDD
jgi:hypothetical protein